MRLLQLTLRNFKKIKELTLDFGGHNVAIFGKNEAGKTTIFDAFTWLLFDKNSSNTKDFNIKTLNANNEPIHMLDHEVIGLIELEPGYNVELKKVFREKWVKKRGESESQFSGHETEYWIDGVPKKKGEYEAYISGICDEKLFKLITNPLYFNEQLAWKDRRKLLLEICGTVDNEEIFSKNPKLTALVELLNKYSIDDLKAMVASQRKKLNEEIGKIPVRIDELNKSLPGETLDFAALEKEKAETEEKLKNYGDMKLEYAKENQAIAMKSRELTNAQTRLESCKFQIEQESKREIIKVKSDLENLRIELQGYNQQQISCIETLKSKNKSLEALNSSRNELRLKFTRVAEEQLIEPDTMDFNCPTCGQALPEDDIKNKIVEIRNNFKIDKEARLQLIRNQGLQEKGNCERLEKDIKDIESNTESLNQKIETANKKIVQLESFISNYKESEIDYNSNAQYKSLQTEIQKLEADLEKAQQPADTTELENTIAKYNTKLHEINAKLVQKDTIEKTNARIQELMQEERKLSQQLAEVEKQQFLCEEYTNTQCNMLEDKINSMFRLVRFKLFNKQINGGIEETCEAMVNGVPYADVNAAGKVQCGLDIINTISSYYNKTAPVFIDNRESVTSIPEMDCQIISLYVDPKRTELYMEVEE